MGQYIIPYLSLRASDVQDKERVGLGVFQSWPEPLLIILAFSLHALWMASRRVRPITDF